MNFEECLYSRRTVRKYEDRNISEEELKAHSVSSSAPCKGLK